MHDKVRDGARLPLVMLVGQSVFFSRRIAARGKWIEDSGGCQVHDYSPFVCFFLNPHPTMFDWPADKKLILSSIVCSRPFRSIGSHESVQVASRSGERAVLRKYIASLTPLRSLQPAFSPLCMVAQSIIDKLALGG